MDADRLLAPNVRVQHAQPGHYRARSVAAFCSQGRSKGYGLTLCPTDMTLHRHVLKRIRKLDATAATHPVRSALNRENPAKVAVVASKRKVVALPQPFCYPFHKSSLRCFPANAPTALRMPKLRTDVDVSERDVIGKARSPYGCSTLQVSRDRVEPPMAESESLFWNSSRRTCSPAQENWTIAGQC